MQFFETPFAARPAQEEQFASRQICVCFKELHKNWFSVRIKKFFKQKSYLET